MIPDPVAVAFTVTEARPGLDAVMTCVPGTSPNVHVVEASPLPPVGVVAGCTVPPPELTVKVTARKRSTMTLPAASATWTTIGCGSVVFTLARCWPPLTTMRALPTCGGGGCGGGGGT